MLTWKAQMDGEERLVDIFDQYHCQHHAEANAELTTDRVNPQWFSLLLFFASLGAPLSVADAEWMYAGRPIERFFVTNFSSTISHFCLPAPDVSLRGWCVLNGRNKQTASSPAAREFRVACCHRWVNAGQHQPAAFCNRVVLFPALRFYVIFLLTVAFISSSGFS